ncbi:MAG: PEP-CTERM sorting domain-containing protein [Gammaproteobacteria bacterium]
MTRRKTLGAILLASCLWIPSAYAGIIYDAGTLEFSSHAQSMWGSGDAFRKEESVFLGSQWSNKTATIGGITGSSNQQIIPGIDAQYITIWEPKIWVPKPTWSNPLAGYWTGCGCNRQLQVTPNIPAVTADTRTGAEVNVHTSGKVGIEFGYAIDSGSVDTMARFGATAVLPDLVNAGEFFSIGTSDIFSEGAITTQSPKAEAYISAIMQLSGSVDAKVCGTFLSCAESSPFALPSIELDQRILSIDPGSLKVLDGFLPSGDPLAEIPIFNQSLTLEGGVSATPPAVGFKLTNSFGGTIVNTLPSPSITADLAEISLNAPDISTTGLGGGEKVTSGGRDDLLSAQLDIDGAATIFAGLPPLGLNFDLIDAGIFKLGASLDLIDVDAGPVLGITQDFEFTPTLMVNIEFSTPIAIATMASLQTSWTGKWSDLPQFSLTQDTTFTPTFWLDSLLKNTMGLDLGLVGTLDVLKLGATASVAGVDLLHFNPLSLNDLFGISNSLFETDKIGFDVYSGKFGLGGFNMIPGPSFTMKIGGAPEIGPGNGSTQVPEPGTSWLMLAGLAGMLIRSTRTQGRTESHRA